MSILSNEEKIILFLSRVNPPTDIVERTKEILRSSYVDYQSILKLAWQNGVAPLLYKNFKALDIIPENAMNAMKTTYLISVSKNFFNEKETMKILTLLKENAIAVIPLKGPLASEIIFGNSGLYPSGDIDILIKPSDMDRAKRVLVEAGYSNYDKDISEKDLISWHYNLVYSSDKHVVEVHWNLVKRYFTIPPGFWWEDTEALEYKDTQITTLSIEKYIMYAVFRLYDHGFRPLRFLVFMSELINKYCDLINWDELFDYVDQHKMRRLVSFTLRLSNEMLRTNIPAYIVQRKIFGYEVIKKFIISGWFQEPRKPHLRKSVFISLQETPHDVLRVIIRQIFPPIGEVRLRYRLTEQSKKAYLYYVLNPFLLFRKRN